MSEWVLHCAVNQRTREAALKDACSQLVKAMPSIALLTRMKLSPPSGIGAQSIDPRPRRSLQIRHSNESEPSRITNRD
jgi:hypothetical protein